jgi:hypothetical protein
MCICSDGLVFENLEDLSYYRLRSIEQICYYEPKLENVLAMKKRITTPKSKTDKKIPIIKQYKGGAYGK